MAITVAGEDTVDAQNKSAGMDMCIHDMYEMAEAGEMRLPGGFK